MQYNSNRKSTINNNNVVVEKDINNDVIDNNVVKDAIDNDVVVEKSTNNNDVDYDYSSAYWAGRREIIIIEREEERRLKNLRKQYDETEVARLKAIIDNKKNDDDDFDFDSWVFDEAGRKVDIAKKAEKDLWEFYGVRYDGRSTDWKGFNNFMDRMSDLYCAVHGGVKADCVKCK